MIEDCDRLVKCETCSAPISTTIAGSKTRRNLDNQDMQDDEDRGNVTGIYFYWFYRRKNQTFLAY
jgi:hypothetical protein